MKKSFLFISCEEAHHICDKSQYGEASFWEKVKLTIRLSWCKISQSYSKKNRALTKAVKASKISGLEADEAQQLKSQFNNQLNDLQ